MEWEAFGKLRSVFKRDRPMYVKKNDIWPMYKSAVKIFSGKLNGKWNICITLVDKKTNECIIYEAKPG